MMAEFTPKTPFAGRWEDPESIEDSLEREAPNDDRRDRYSKEYSDLATGSAESSLPETGAVPDGADTIPEGADFVRARGENIEGSKIVAGEDDEAPTVETPDSEGYASDWKGSEAASERAARAQHPSPEEIEDDEPKKRTIPPTNPDLPSGR